MANWKKGTVPLLILLCFHAGFSQQHDASHQYIPPADPLVVKKLAQWQDQKFGLMMHWGTYSQWGVVESWSICPEDEGWCQRKGPFSSSWFDYLKAYEGLRNSFNPVRFNPEKWADAAADAGMKYLVFTTKHHDGFCMFDTRQTDYRITSPATPFSSDSRANISKEIFNSFRNRSFLIGAYFSKPDWHNENYWWPYFPPKDRNPSYHPAKYPEKWEAFKKFTYNQIEELMTGYGQVDILWLDGGWVRPFSTIDTSVSWQKSIPFDQDINMAGIAAMARRHQPGLLVVDRTVSGEFENYVTPEQQVPFGYLPYPWESCITLGNSWSYVPGDQYKTARQIIHLLTDIVSRGGNLLLNIGPGPDGDWDTVAYARLREIGKWLKINGEAIYGTHASAATPKNGRWVYTHGKDETYAILQLDEQAVQTKELLIPRAWDGKVTGLSVPGFTGKLKFKERPDGLLVTWPQLDRKKFPDYAHVFRIRYK
jgi:alpha-L-fucosidase